MNILEAMEYLANKNNYDDGGMLITEGFSQIEPYEFAQIILRKMSVFMRDVIEQEIKWCEENHGMKSKEFEDGFIAGLKQVIFLVDAAAKMEKRVTEEERGLTKRAADFADCHACGIAYPNTATRCTKCGGKLQSR